MRKAIVILLMCLYTTALAQTHVEYISERSDSMALINKADIDIINKVFNERNVLDSLNVINEKIIQSLEETQILQDSVILKQEQTIENNKIIQEELIAEHSVVEEAYQKEIRSEKRKTISFQALSGVGIIAIILLILL